MGADPLRLVVDANILVAAFLKAATTRNLLLDYRLKLYSPDDLLVEAQKVLRGRLSKRWSSKPGFDFDEIFSALTSGIRVIPKSDYQDYIGRAFEIAPHAEDAPYLALALHLSIPLWSNDEGMKNQSLVQVFSSTGVLDELKKNA